MRKTNDPMFDKLNQKQINRLSCYSMMIESSNESERVEEWRSKIRGYLECLCDCYIITTKERMKLTIFYSYPKREGSENERDI